MVGTTLECEGAFAALADAESAGLLGDVREVRRLVEQALKTSADILIGLGVELETWPEWAAFGIACITIPDPLDRLLLRVRGPSLPSRVVHLRERLQRLAFLVDEATNQRGLRAGLADSYESILDQVWRSEREWAFDDRIALSVIV